MAQNSVVAEGEEMNTLLSEYLNIMSGNGSEDENPDKPDTTGPSISLQTSSTENTITVIVTATDESEKDKMDQSLKIQQQYRTIQEIL